MTIMPKGKSLKMKCNLCNIPITEVFDTYKSLRKSAYSSGLVIVKLKRKVEYKSHEPVGSVFV